MTDDAMERQYQYHPGDRLDSFTIEEGLFCGALSQVYRGTDTRTHRAVVIKVPSLDIINNPLVYYHFQNEIQVLDTLDHPAVVKIVRGERTAAYSVFEHIAGHDLYRLMKREGPFSLDRARHYVREVGRALSYIHGCGTIHMDIKPENIMITPDDAVKIVDFGLARQLGAPDVLQEDFTRPHGTPYYAAPEQLEHYRDDPRTDLYSLAVVLYEMLTGQLPFERTRDLARVRRRLKTDPIPPRTHRGDIPESVEAVILKALARRPADRHADVEAFVLALDAAVDPGETAAPAPPFTASRTACPIRPALPRPDARLLNILAALDDNDRADAVVATALQEARQAEGAAVTLLTVVSGDGDNEWTRYADAVTGDRWGRRLEAFARRFRRAGIEPTVRILTGVPADRIVATARKSGADLIILGAASRPWFKRLFGGRNLERVRGNAPCDVRVADAPPPAVLPGDTEVSS